MVSKLGTWMQNTAEVLLAYKLTHSCLAVGLVHLSVTIRLRFAPRGAYGLVCPSGHRSRSAGMSSARKGWSSSLRAGDNRTEGEMTTPLQGPPLANGAVRLGEGGANGQTPRPSVRAVPI